MSGLANTTRRAMALLALLFAMLAAPAAASPDAGSRHVAGILAAESVETSAEREFEPRADPAGNDGGDALAAASVATELAPLPAAATAFPRVTPSRRDATTRSYRARAPPRG